MIKVEVEELKNELTRLNSAIAAFESYSSSFMGRAVEGLDQMNSDFTDKMSKSLNNMTDTKAPELLKKIQTYYLNLLTLVQEFERTDNEISDQVEIEEEVG